jgi:hypothetical protein
MNGFNATNSLHTGGVTGSIPVAPTTQLIDIVARSHAHHRNKRERPTRNAKGTHARKVCEIRVRNSDSFSSFTPHPSTSSGAEKMIRNRGTPEGHELGKHLARFCDEAEPKARLCIHGRRLVSDVPPGVPLIDRN